MSGGRHPDLERELRAYRAPGEDEAFERSLRILREADRDLPRRVQGRLPSLRIALAGAAAVVAVIGLTPAGADVREWIDDRIDGVGDERPALTGIPGGGRLLVTSAGGAWVVAPDGARRRLGPYDDATWSPGGLYVAAVRGRQLVAVDPFGNVRWSIPAPARVSDPRWAPTGLRIAYRSDGDLRVVEGDGSDEELLARGVAPVAPAWRPPPAGAVPASHVLAYVNRTGQIVIRDVESGSQIVGSSGVDARSIAWLSHNRLVVAGRRFIQVLDGSLRLVATFAAGPVGSKVGGVAVSLPTGRIAIVRTRVVGSSISSELVSARIGHNRTIHRRTLFAGPGEFSNPAFSPDGRWLVMGWRDADQWLFLRPVADRKLLRGVIAVGQIARQFDPAGEAQAAFPRIEGWCCEG